MYYIKKYILNIKVNFPDHTETKFRERNVGFLDKNAKINKKNLAINFYKFGICSGDIIRRASPIIIKGDTKENNASNATTIPAAGIGRPVV